MIHGKKDKSVPTSFSRKVLKTFVGAKKKLIIIKNGDHSLSNKKNLKNTFILSKGHGCLALYALLADKKFFSKDILKTASKFNSILGGHPEFGKVPGVEASTGSLGHGPAIGLGMAIAAKLNNLNLLLIVNVIAVNTGFRVSIYGKGFIKEL